ncbi:MAG: diacylglycerol kinase family protein [Pseudomonadota bacterium]
MSIGLIINERSDRSASVVDDLLHVARKFSSVRPAILNGIDGLDKTLSEMGRKGVETLIIGGGDGTLQAAFTDSINNARFERQPDYVALPCGMTNVIANDCGLRGAPVAGLDNFLWRRQRGDVQPVTRHLMAVKNGAQKPIYGFFFGCAGFHSAVKYSREKIQRFGAKRSLQLMASVAGYVSKVAFDTNNTVESVDLSITQSDAPEQQGTHRQLLAMATTLHSIGSGIYPFWGEGDGPMAVTTVRHPRSRLLRATPSILRGKSRPWFRAHGYESWRERQLSLEFDGPFVFDGEIFEAQRSAPLVIDTSRQAQFLY